MTRNISTAKDEKILFHSFFLLFNIFQVNREKEYAVKQEEKLSKHKGFLLEKTFSTGSRENWGESKKGRKVSLEHHQQSSSKKMLIIKT
jgi:hypothetical protein